MKSIKKWFERRGGHERVGCDRVVNENALWKPIPQFALVLLPSVDAVLHNNVSLSIDCRSWQERKVYEIDKLVLIFFN